MGTADLQNDCFARLSPSIGGKETLQRNVIDGKAADDLVEGAYGVLDKQTREEQGKTVWRMS